MDRVTDQLYIGKYDLAYQPNFLQEAGITSVVKLFESPPDWPAGFRLLNEPFPDGEPCSSDRLARLDRHIAGEIYEGQRVLVVCGAGISRSATVVLSYLVSEGMSLHDAYLQLKQHHPESEPHPALWESLIGHHQLPLTLFDVIGWRNEAANSGRS